MKTKSRFIAEAGEADPVGEILNVSTVICDDGSATITTTYANPAAQPEPATRRRAARKTQSPEVQSAPMAETEQHEEYKSSPAAETCVEVEPAPAVATDPAGGALVRDSVIAITGLPGAASAYSRALDLARVIIRREPAHAVTISDSAGAVLFTIDAAHLATLKAAKARKAPTQPREARTAPDGKRAEVVALCMRAEGASTKELDAMTGWKGCPWAWTIGTNKNGTGLADRYGYGFHKTKDGDETRYFLTPAA